MILESLKMKNFRQYYGEQKIDFSRDPDKNITVIHGENGSGKTAMLNAFSWLLYGHVSKNLDQPNRIINEKAISEIETGETVEIEVELIFQHDSKKYFARRINKLEKKEKRMNIKTNQMADDIEGRLVYENLDLRFTDFSGKNISINNPSNALQQILPERIKDLFFFHGEYIDTLAKEENSDEIRKAIQIIMGLTILERAISHLSKAGKRFEEELGKLGGSKLSEFIKKKQNLESDILSLKEENGEYKSNIGSLKKTQEAIDAKLKLNIKVKESQERREDMEKKKKSLQEGLAKIDKKMKSECSKNSYLFFLLDIESEIKKILKEKESNDEIPTPYKKRFIKRLIQEKKCICGTEIRENTAEYDSVMKWLEKASPDGLDDAVSHIIAYLPALDDGRKKSLNDLTIYMRKKDEILNELNELNEKIDDIGGEFKKIEEIKNLEKSRDNCIEEVGRNTNQIEVNDKKILDHQSEIDSIDRDINGENLKQDKAKLAKKRYQVSKQAQQKIEEIYSKITHKVREEMQTVVGDLYTQFINKPFWAEISDNYELEIYKKVGEDKIKVSMSTGERQVASLAFIGGLVGIAKDRYDKKRDAKYFKGGIYPIVMDAPFGYLDEEYRKQIAIGIPKMSDQVIIFVTSSQWTGEVEKAMLHRAGKQFSLNYRNPVLDQTVEHEFTTIEERC